MARLIDHDFLLRRIEGLFKESGERGICCYKMCRRGRDMDGNNQRKGRNWQWLFSTTRSYQNLLIQLERKLILTPTVLLTLIFTLSKIIHQNIFPKLIINKKIYLTQVLIEGLYDTLMRSFYLFLENI